MSSELTRPLQDLHTRLRTDGRLRLRTPTRAVGEVLGVCGADELT